MLEDDVSDRLADRGQHYVPLLWRVVLVSFAVYPVTSSRVASRASWSLPVKCYVQCAVLVVRTRIHLMWYSSESSLNASKLLRNHGAVICNDFVMCVQQRYREGQLVSTRGEKYIVEDLRKEWNGGSKGKIMTKGKRGKGFV
jgi:hypothetical protein